MVFVETTRMDPSTLSMFQPSFASSYVVSVCEAFVPRGQQSSTSKHNVSKSYMTDSSYFGVTHSKHGSPPIIHVPYELQTSTLGHDAYNRALDDHGPVVIIPRHGRQEYIIDNRYVHEVFTDAKRFSFERALVDVLHIEFMLWVRNGRFVRDCREMAQLGLYRRMPVIVDKIGPVFELAFDKFDKRLNEVDVIQTLDLYDEVQQVFAQAMNVLFMGTEHADETSTKHFTAIATAMAHLIGIYERIDGWRYAPGLYRLYKLITAGLFIIVPHMFFGLLPKLWRSRRSRMEDGRAAKKEKTVFVPLFDLFLSELWCGGDGLIGFANFVYCGFVGIAVIFAAVHQTVVVAVWVIIELAKRKDEYLDPIRNEWRANLNNSVSSPGVQSMVNPAELTYLDSFIREVILSKSNLIGPMRTTTCTVQIGPYILPPNALCIPYPRHLLPQPEEAFDGFQWRAKEKQAGQGDPGFFNFGLGQWACPGRHLAVHEIKILVGSMFSRFEVSIEGGTYTVADPLFTMSVPPHVKVELVRTR